MFRTLSLLISLALFSLPVAAQSTNRLDHLDATLLPGWQTESGSQMAGLQLVLSPGWKTYWRSPGEAGLPPLFDWSGSENVLSVRVHWPSPDVFSTNGMQSIGYHDAVTLPLEVTPRDPAKPVTLHARVDLGICRDICLPASLDLAVALVRPGAANALINTALAARPMGAKAAGLSAITCTVDPIADGLRIKATLALPRQGEVETVAFEAGQPDIWVAGATSNRSGDILTAVTEMVGPSGAPFALERGKMRLTVIAKGKAVDIQGCPAP
jgi:DsbC/DsbD-like thiol-disulfide interchange protein